jgi:Na+/H+-dicarboxylate symporter
LSAESRLIKSANRAAKICRRTDWTIKNFTEPIGQLFLNLLLMIVVPLVFSSLVVGVAGIGDIRKLGRVGFKSFAYCLIISAISVVIGLGLANTIRRGTYCARQSRRASGAIQNASRRKRVESNRRRKKRASRRHDSALMSVVKTIVPKNVSSSIAGENPNMLHLMFFALIIGVAITLLPERRFPVRSCAEWARFLKSRQKLST